ncbi:MAG: hypothetical protein A2X46_18620 [Lentisphaerae bacterium GWF2_57_35]|nr:MAG: hypothetical protein A2X46_18620 [Lentisphaerae bacterium GWF2_57_35]
MSRNIWASRGLIWELGKRDLFGQYKNYFLGSAWILISPILEVCFWLYLQKTGILKPGDTPIPYPAYIYIGLTMWGMFVAFYNAGVSTLKSAGGMLMQVNFPHEAYLLKQTLHYLFTFTIQLAMALLVLLMFGVIPSWKIVFLPLAALPLFCFGAAIGLVLSLSAVMALDVAPFMNFILRILMLSIPVVYAPAVQSPLAQTINQWNPLTYLVCSCRDLVIYGRLYDTVGYALSAMLAVVLFLIALKIFFVSEKRVIERMVS